MSPGGGKMLGMSFAPTSPDPISDPQAYQQHLLGLLGEDDPAEVQDATPAAVRAIVAEAGPDLQARPADREWSVYGCVAHLADAELVMSARYRWVLAHDDPPLIGYDQDLWVDGLRHGRDDPAALLALFVALRLANLDLWSRSTAEERDRVGLHEERGPESYELIFRLAAGHDRFHVAQAHRALAAVRA
jgi:DinB superfamily